MSIKHKNTESLSSVATSPWIIVNTKVNPFNVTSTVVLSAGAVLTYTVEYTVDNLADEAAAGQEIDLPEMVGQTATLTKAVVSPITAVRLNVTAYTSGTATLTVQQAGVNNLT